MILILCEVISYFDEENKKYPNNAIKKMMPCKFHNTLRIVASKVFEALYIIKNVKIRKENA